MLRNSDCDPQTGGCYCHRKEDILIPFVNYFFDENYDSSAVIKRMRNEQFVEHKDHSGEKRITDSHFQITQNGISKNYHLECESKAYDGSILLRLFEYDAQIALAESETDNHTLKIRIPHSGVLLLRESSRAPDDAEIIIETPEGSISYHVPVIKETDFTIESIFEKRLYLLIPFYIFNFEKELKDIDADVNKTDAMADLYRSIIEKLDGDQAEGRLSTLSHSVIIWVTHRVVFKFMMKHENVQKKVGDVMGGKVLLDLPPIKAYDTGKAEGKAEGEVFGKEKLLVEQICKKLKKGKSVAEIAEALEEDEPRIQAIINAVEKYAPDYNVDEILKELLQPV